jgi:recombination protein RecA
MENCDGISTGSLELDVAMGGKGIPIGRITRFYGSYSSSKTLNSYNIIREAQQQGLTCAYYNAEKQYSPDFVEARGVNSSELTVVEGTTIEEIGDKMEALLGVVHVHILDSCSVAVSEDELTADIRDWRPGITARAWGKVFRRINERFDRDNTILLIDQVRTDFKTGGENPAGGRVLDHQSSMTVHFKKGGWLFRNSEGYLDEKAKQVKGMSGQMEPAGIEIKARIVKSRVCRPFRTATMRLDLDTLNFDRTFELVKAAKHYKLVEQRGAYFYIDGEQIAQGDKQLRAYIETDPEFAERISATAIRAVDS